MPPTASLSTTSLRILAAGLAAMSLLIAPNAGAAEARATLTCTNLASRVSWQIRIDFERQTVDSNPARISSAEISWQDAKDGGHYTLDRRTGELTVVFASSTGGYFIHDRCSHPVR